MLVKIPRKDTTTDVAALAKHIRKLPEELRRSLTWDQGKGMHAHKRFTFATNVQVYFCDPRSPWQRGTNEDVWREPARPRGWRRSSQQRTFQPPRRRATQLYCKNGWLSLWADPKFTAAARINRPDRPHLCSGLRAWLAVG